MDRIAEWLERGDDFEAGLALLSEVLPNRFYLDQIRRKGAVRGLETVRYELRKRRSPPAPQRGEKAQAQAKAQAKDLKDRKDLKDEKDTKAQAQAKVQAKAGFVLREAFPFLGRDDCPEELKVLVADMITAHDRYIIGHERLYEVQDKGGADCFAAAEELVENYLENRAIWDELQHYKVNGKVLGVHPIFWKRKRRGELEAMEVWELTRQYRNLPRSINYYKKLLAEDKESELNQERKDKLALFEWEYNEVKKILRIEDGKQKRAKAGKAKSAGGRR